MAFASYSATPSANTTIGGVYIGEGCSPGSVNNAVRQLMADGKLTANDIAALGVLVTSIQGNTRSGFIGYATYAGLVAAYQAYNAGTAYTTGKTATDQGAFWVAIDSTTGNAPPTLPATSNAYWRLITATPAGQLAQVPTTDAGTHTDPVVGGTVPNTGIFRWSTSPVGWERIYDTDAALGAGYAQAASASADLAQQAADDAQDAATALTGSLTGIEDKVGGSPGYTPTRIGNPLVPGSAAFAGYAFIADQNPTVAAGPLETLEQYVQTVGSGANTMFFVSGEAGNYTVEAVYPLTGLTAGANVIPKTGQRVGAGWRVGFWVPSGGALPGYTTVAPGGGGAHATVLGSAPTVGQSLSLASSDALLAIGATYGVVTGGAIDPRLAAAEAKVALLDKLTARFPLYPKLDAAWKQGRGVICCIGDSTTVPVIGNGSGGFLYADNDEVGPPAVVASTLAQYGGVRNCVNFGDRGMLAFGASVSQLMSQYSPDIVAGAGWDFGSSDQANMFGGRMLTNSTTTNALSWTPPTAFDRLEVSYITAPSVGLGSFTVDVDGGAPLATYSEDATASVQRVVLNVTRGTHTVNFKRVSGSVFLLEMRAYDSTRRTVQLVNAGIAGATTATFIAATTAWAPQNAIPRMDADLFLINLGLNDKNQGVPVATYKTRLKSIASNCIAAGADAQLIIPTPASSGHNLDAAYIQAIKDAASELGLQPPVDLYTLFGSYAASIADYSDEVHLKPSGYARVGAAEAAQLIAPSLAL